MSEQEPARITAFAETIRKHIARRSPSTTASIFLTASIGLALAIRDPTLDEIIKDAELAMYHSKRMAATHRCL